MSSRLRKTARGSGRTARLKRYHVAKMLQEGRKFSKADGALPTSRCSSFHRGYPAQMNMLQAWTKGLNVGLNAAINVGMPSIQSAHYGVMADRVDKP
jgi:hypothetical protein